MVWGGFTNFSLWFHVSFRLVSCCGGGVISCGLRAVSASFPRLVSGWLHVLFDLVDFELFCVILHDVVGFG